MLNLLGKQFGRLTVLSFSHINKSRQSIWLCKCGCGNQITIRGSSLTNKHTKSCGCLQREVIKKIIQNNIIHGYKRIEGSRTYSVWRDMKGRCSNQKRKGYKNYGGRGIVVCQRWIKFPNFLKDMGEAPEGLQLERMNNNKGYCKSNCRWATPKEQQRNRRNNHLETYNEKTQCVAAWAEELNIPQKILITRLFRGWSIKRALTTPYKRRVK